MEQKEQTGADMRMRMTHFAAWKKRTNENTFTYCNCNNNEEASAMNKNAEWWWPFYTLKGMVE